MSHLKRRRARRELLILLLLATVTTSVFWLTDLDVQLAALFYNPDHPKGPWPYQYWLPIKIFYDYAFPVTIVAGASSLLIYIGGHFHGQVRRFRRRALYILLVIGLGPGLLVNLVAKDHWGRSRPVHIQQFGGQYQYVPPGQFGHTPDKSFVCGHCSVGYTFFVLYFLSQNHKLLYFLMTLAVAWFMGAARMSAGGHFVSDILWSGYLTFLAAYALYYGWFVRGKALQQQDDESQ